MWFFHRCAQRILPVEIKTKAMRRKMLEALGLRDKINALWNKGSSAEWFLRRKHFKAFQTWDPSIKKNKGNDQYFRKEGPSKPRPFKTMALSKPRHLKNQGPSRWSPFEKKSLRGKGPERMLLWHEGSSKQRSFKSIALPAEDTLNQGPRNEKTPRNEGAFASKTPLRRKPLRDEVPFETFTLRDNGPSSRRPFYTKAFLEKNIMETKALIDEGT